MLTLMENESNLEPGNILRVVGAKDWALGESE